MRAISVLVAICIPLSAGSAQMVPGQGTTEQHSGARLYEGLSGLGGMLIDAACGGAVAFAVGSGDVTESPTGGFVVVVAALPFALALPACAGIGVSAVGGILHEDGSTGGAYAGAYLAVPVAVGLGVLGAASGNSAGVVAGVTAATLAIPAGAVIGYNIHAGRGANETTFFGRRLGLPAVAFDRVERDGRAAELGLRIQLASVRF